jgi:hypothetical protein
MASSNKEGKNLEDIVKSQLEHYDYEYIPNNKFKVATQSLKQKLYTTQLYMRQHIFRRR